MTASGDPDLFDEFMKRVVKEQGERKGKGAFPQALDGRSDFFDDFMERVVREYREKTQRKEGGLGS
jgi:hypothetical protein